jgi:hypothetical protein
MATVVTYEEFIADARFSVFKALPRDKIQPLLDTAHRTTSESAAGTVFRDVILYKTAVFLSADPTGFPASKTRSDGPNMFERVLSSLRAGIVGGPLVSGCQ